MVRKIGTARRIAVAAVRRRPVVLCYHRVAAVAHDPWELAVTAEDFDGHLGVLAATGRPVLPLDELQRRTAEGRAPRGAVAITFDDGYVDNLTEAAPILERHGAHATMFVVTGSIGSTTTMWWDRLAAIAATRSDIDIDVDAHWDGLQRMAPDERDRELDRLAGEPTEPTEPTERMMTADELARLDALDHVTVGSHTVTHPKLTVTDRRTHEGELTESKATLEEILGRDVDLLAYPHGAADPEIAATARRAGYRLAVTTEGRPLRKDDHPLLLPRLTVGSWSPERFARVLRSFG